MNPSNRIAACTTHAALRLRFAQPEGSLSNRSPELFADHRGRAKANCCQGGSCMVFGDGSSKDGFNQARQWASDKVAPEGGPRPGKGNHRSTGKQNVGR
jgi:hypothetical protein